MITINPRGNFKMILWESGLFDPKIDLFDFNYVIWPSLNSKLLLMALTFGFAIVFWNIWI